MKAQTVPAITPKTFKEMVSPWLTAIHKKDLLAVMSYPASDRQRRLGNLLDQPETMTKYLPKSTSYIWITVDFRVDAIASPKELEALILQKISQQILIDIKNTDSLSEAIETLNKKYSKTIVLASIGCEKLLTDKRTDILIWSVLQQRIGLIRQLLFFEANLLDQANVRFFGTVPTFLPRISLLSLYEKEDVMQFMQLKEHDWNFQVDKTTKERIYSACGGVLLLTKSALRLLRDTPHASLDSVWKHIEMQFDVASFWHGFGLREQLVLQAIEQGLALEDSNLSPSLHYLLQTGVVRQKKNRFEITVPLLAMYIRSAIPKTYRFALEKDSILLNGTPIDANFSKNERVALSFLIRANNEIISRSALADFIWPDNKGDYSDWAIDSIVSRIRKKLSSLGVSPNVITVQKKRGVRLTNNS